MAYSHHAFNMRTKELEREIVAHYMERAESCQNPNVEDMRIRTIFERHREGRYTFDVAIGTASRVIAEQAYSDFGNQLKEAFPDQKFAVLVELTVESRRDQFLIQLADKISKFLLSLQEADS